MYEDRICVLHPQQITEYFALSSAGKLRHCRKGTSRPVREYGSIPTLLKTQNEVRSDSENDEVPREENDGVDYQEGYIAEILWPWLAMFQEYGTNGCVCNLESGEIRLFSREFYHADVSCFSAALFRYQGHICLLHATQWNRLDMTDLDTGCLMTDREVYYRELPEKKPDGNFAHEESHYIDYFHGRVSFSPDYRHFVDTGWIWQPIGVPFLYSVEGFLQKYDEAYIPLCGGDDWDQPAVWTDERHFLLPFIPDSDFCDDEMPPELKKGENLLRFCVEDVQHGENGDYLCAKSSLAFPTNMKRIRVISPGKDQPDRYELEDFCPGLCYDSEENILLSLDGRHCAVWNMTTGQQYSFTAGPSCFAGEPQTIISRYSVEHHAVYFTPMYNGAFDCIPLREALACISGTQ